MGARRGARRPRRLRPNTARASTVIDPTELFVIETGWRPVGFIQRYRISDNPTWAAALSCDQATRALPSGSTTRLAKSTPPAEASELRQSASSSSDTFSRYPDVDSIVVAMQQANRSSWRGSEHVGFERRWAGLLDSPDPSDAGPSYIYVIRRAAGR